MLEVNSFYCVPHVLCCLSCFAVSPVPGSVWGVLILFRRGSVVLFSVNRQSTTTCLYFRGKPPHTQVVPLKYFEAFLQGLFVAYYSLEVRCKWSRCFHHSTTSFCSSRLHARAHTHALPLHSLARCTTSPSKICLLSRGGLQQLQTSTTYGWTRKGGCTWKGSLSARFVLIGLPRVLCTVVFPFLGRDRPTQTISVAFPYISWILCAMVAFSGRFIHPWSLVPHLQN